MGEKKQNAFSLLITVQELDNEQLSGFAVTNFGSHTHSDIVNLSLLHQVLLSLPNLPCLVSLHWIVVCEIRKLV